MARKLVKEEVVIRRNTGERHWRVRVWYGNGNKSYEESRTVAKTRNGKPLTKTEASRIARLYAKKHNLPVRVSDMRNCAW